MEQDTTFYAFKSNIKHFLGNLLKEPITAQPSKFLKERGFNKKKLINILLKRDVIERHEKIDDEETPNYIVNYKVKRKNFEKKIKRIYIKYFEKNEIDEATACGVASGAYVQPMFNNVIRREFKNESRTIIVTEKQLDFIKENIVKS